MMTRTVFSRDNAARNGNAQSQKMHSFARRVTVSLALMIIVISFAILAFVYIHTLHEGRREIDRKADEYLHYLSEALSLPLWNLDKDAADLIARSVFQNDLVIKLKVVDGFDQVAVSMKRASAAEVVTRAADILYNGELVGKISFDLSTRSNREKVKELLVTFALFVTLILIVVLFFTGFLVRGLLRGPLEAIDKITETYSAGNYTPPVVQSGFLEFQPIVDVLSQMGGEISRQLENVKAAEQKYRTIYENSIEGIFQSTLEGRYLSVNPAFAKIHGFDTPAELMSHVTDIKSQTYVNPEDWERWRQTVAMQGRVQGFEVEKYRRDGRRIWVSINARAVNDASAASEYYEGSMVDITERKQIEVELAMHRDHLEEQVKERTVALSEAMQQAEAANAAKSDFLASMSHELRTPLNAILGYAQIFKRRNPDADLAKGLDTIQHSGEHLLTLINDILDTAKIEVGKVTLSPEPVRLNTFLETIMGIIRSRAEAKGLAARLETPATLPKGVMADAVRLRQVLLNLLNNAVKFTDSGGVTLRVTCWDSAPASDADQPYVDVQLCFEVTDTGIGIAADQIERIFSPFEQASGQERGTGGSGLGLHISRQLVGLMGGDLTVESKPGRGATFGFTIVVPKDQAPADETVTAEPTITGFNGPKRRVLVVDDIDNNRAVLADMLTPLGFDLAQAGDGRQAITVAQDNVPDLILMDRYMPVMDGLVAIKEMRRIPELKKVPVLAISASVAQEDSAEMITAGYDDFVSKPVRWAHLAALLQRHLNLEWQYAGPEARPQKDSRDTRALTAPPKAELTLLHELAMMGDMEAIISRAAHIEDLDEGYGPFVRRLKQLAEAFEDGKIQLMVEQCMQASP